MRAVIIDDDILNIELIDYFCKQYTPAVEVVGTAETVEEGIDVLRQTKPDLLFLDMSLHDRTGFDVIHGIDDPELMVIVISAYHKHDVRSMKVRVMDYLLKPVYIPEFIESVSKCQQAFDERNNLQEAEIAYVRQVPNTFGMIPISEHSEVMFVRIDGILHHQEEILLLY